jgi:hypothetical protein
MLGDLGESEFSTPLISDRSDTLRPASTINFDFISKILIVGDSVTI